MTYNDRPLVCSIHRAEVYADDVCPCYRNAIAEDIRTTWSKIDLIPAEMDATIDLKDQMLTVAILSEGAYNRANGKGNDKPISARELITELTIIISCAQYAKECAQKIASKNGENERVLF